MRENIYIFLATDKGRWVLIDLDAACRLGEAAGQKRTSSGCYPPELARQALRPRDEEAPVLASVQLEVWYFGVLVYQLCTLDGLMLWQNDQADNIREEDLRTLAQRWAEVKQSKLASVVWPDARALLDSLLQADADARPARWADVLNDPFLTGALDGAVEELCADTSVFVSSPEYGYPVKRCVMDYIKTVCDMFSGHMSMGFDWATSGNSYAEDSVRCWDHWGDATKAFFAAGGLDAVGREEESAVKVRGCRLHTRRPCRHDR